MEDNNIIQKDYRLIIEVNNKKIKCDKNSYFYINKDDTIDYCSFEDFDKKDFKNILFRVRKSKKTGKYIIINPINIIEKKNIDNTKLLENKLWYIISNEEGYNIKQGDIIKFHKIIYEIIELKISNKESNNNYILLLNDNQYKLEEYNPEKIIDIYKSDNPKVCLCKCENEFIFFKELKNKIKNSLIIKKEENYMTYFCDKFHCEKCGVQYPYKFKIPNNPYIFYLIEIIPNNYKNFIILEYLYNESDLKNKKIPKIIHIINEKEKIIGRDIICFDELPDANKQTNNNSYFNEYNKKISREHSSIFLNDNNFNIKNKSPNGTFVLNQNGFIITEKNINFKSGDHKFQVYLEEIKEDEINYYNHEF